MRVAQLLAFAAILLPTPLAGQEKPPFPTEVRNPDAVLKAIAEKYPPLLQEAGIQDSVLVEFGVASNGEVQETKIVRASDHDALNNAALAVARMVVFGTQQDPRTRRIRVEIRFRVPMRDGDVGGMSGNARFPLGPLRGSTGIGFCWSPD